MCKTAFRRAAHQEVKCVQLKDCHCEDIGGRQLALNVLRLVSCRIEKAFGCWLKRHLKGVNSDSPPFDCAKFGAKREGMPGTRKMHESMACVYHLEVWLRKIVCTTLFQLDGGSAQKPGSQSRV